MIYDVAIIGGGPCGSTCSSLLRKYNPALKVLVLEKEKFPREHVGESQLPLIGRVLHEMGVWDKVEAAGFPIKLGATYRWGQSKDLWDFEFIPSRVFRDEPRPAAFQGQRIWTAFQVERAIYDKILLDHAASLGVEVRQETRVDEVLRTGDRVDGLRLSTGETIEARHYVDASGHIGILRRAVGVECDYPGNIKNVAFWDYWDNAEWAVTIGNGGTRVFVLSVASGWIWFIPIRPYRVSVGFICPAEYYRTCGKTPEELYAWALSQEPLVMHHTRNATREGGVRTTKDWSFLARRMYGENWFLAGEAAGFADPILAGGLMLAHAGARELAYVLLELSRGEHDPAWLRERFSSLQFRRIGQHIRFADFWYAGNGCFTDLEDLTRKIASDAGISLDAKRAFQWLSNGGFMEDIPGRAGIGGLDVAASRIVAGKLTDGTEIDWTLNSYNVFRFNLDGAREGFHPVLQAGRIQRARCFTRGTATLPIVGANALLFDAMSRHSFIVDIARQVRAQIAAMHLPMDNSNVLLQQTFQALEAMLMEGWVTGTLDPTRRRITLGKQDEDHSMIHRTRDVALPTPAGGS